MSDIKDVLLLIQLLNKQTPPPFNANSLIMPALMIMLIFYLLITKTQAAPPEIRYVQAPPQPIQYQRQPKIKNIPISNQPFKQFEEIQPLTLIAVFNIGMLFRLT